MANLRIRLNRIADGMAQAGPNSPVFVGKGKKLIKLTREAYSGLEEEAESLSFFAGRTIFPEQLIK